MFRNLIFDLDGCLIDSLEVQKCAFFGSYQEVVGDGKCPSFQEYLKYTGASVEEVLLKLNLPLEMAAPFRRISRSLVGKISVNREAFDLISELKIKGSKIGLVTGKDHDRTLQILKHFKYESCFDALVCADDVKEHKPSPAPIIKCIELMNVPKDSCLMVGDGYSDIMSAKNAGIKSVLTLWYGDFDVKREANYIAESVYDLRKILHL